MERLVFWQALFYTISFYVTWPIVFCVYITGWDYSRQVYAFSAMVAFVAPLQGFNNCLVYTRPRIAKKMEEIAGSLRSTGLLQSSRQSESRNGAATDSGQTHSIAGVRIIDPSVAIAEEEPVQESRPTLDGVEGPVVSLAQVSGCVQESDESFQPVCET